jgi:hypothetical protein
MGDIHYPEGNESGGHGENQDAELHTETSDPAEHG